MTQIFISYSHKDKIYAHKLHKYLMEQGFDAWIDDRIDYGTLWPKEIEKRVKTCAAFILIMSPNSKNSEWVQNELSLAKELNKPIFPLLLAGKVWWVLKTIQYLDIKGGKLPPSSFIDCLAKVATHRAPVSQPNDNKNLPADKKKDISIVIGIISLMLTLAGFIFGDNIYQRIIDKQVDQTPTTIPTATSYFGLTPVVAIMPTNTPFITETVTSTSEATFTPEPPNTIAQSNTPTSFPVYSCITVNEQPVDETQIRRGRSFKVSFTVINNGPTVWPEDLVLDIVSNPYSIVSAPSLPKNVHQVQPSGSFNVGPFDAKAPDRDGHYVVSFQIGDFCYPYIAFDVVK